MTLPAAAMLRTPALFAWLNASSSVRLLNVPPRLMLTTLASASRQEFSALTSVDEYVQSQEPSASASLPKTLTMWRATPGLTPTTPVPLPAIAAMVPATWLP
jgi:hypothetical protein